MHRRKIFGALIFVAMTAGLGSSQAFAAKSSKSAKAAKADVFTEFEKKLGTLETELQKEKDVTKRYDIFLKHYREISDLRAKNPRQAEEKELSMSLYMDSLNFLPVKKDFSPKKCGEYKKEVATMMKSYDKEQKEPFVDRALKLVDLICK